MEYQRPADKPIVLPFTRSTTSEIPPARPLPGAKFLHPTVRNHFVAFLGEFVGTFLFLFFAFAATQVANMINPGIVTVSGLLYISLAFGFSLAVTVSVFFRISGGLFNPAVGASFLNPRASNTLIIPGHIRIVPDWSCRMAQRLHRHRCPDTRCYCGSWNRIRTLFRSFTCPHHFELDSLQDFNRQGAVHRDVLDSPAGFHNASIHPSRKEHFN